MFLTIAALIIPIILLFVADVQTFLATCLLTNGLVICYRIYRRENPISQVLLFAVYGLLLAIMAIGNSHRFEPFTGSFIYGSLALLSLIGCLTTPWTLPASQAHNPQKRRQHRLGNAVLLVFNAGALWLSVSLFPNPLYIYLPLGLTALSIPTSRLLPQLVLRPQ